MLIFEIATTNTPLPEKSLAPVLIDPPNKYVAYATQVMISSVKQKLFHRNYLEQCLHCSVIAWSSNLWNRQSTFSNRHCFYLKKNGVNTPVLLTYQEETKQPRRPIADLPLFEFSPALESWSDPIFTRVQEAASFCRRFPLLFFIRYLYLSVTRLGCSLNVLSGGKSLSSISWLDTPLTANWLQVFVFGPESVFSNVFEKLLTLLLKPDAQDVDLTHIFSKLFTVI